jgi:hypothetical protein
MADGRLMDGWLAIVTLLLLVVLLLLLLLLVVSNTINLYD